MLYFLKCNWKIKEIKIILEMREAIEAQKALKWYMRDFEVIELGSEIFHMKRSRM